MATKAKVTMGEESAPKAPEEAMEEVLHEGTPDSEETMEAPVTSIDDLDPAEELWPNGPTVGDIKVWKEEFGDVFVTSIDADRHIVWRTMSRSEYKQMLRTMEQATASGQMSNVDASMFNEEYVTQMCSLFPDFHGVNMDNVDAGIPSIISQQVMDASGFVALEVRQL